MGPNTMHLLTKHTDSWPLILKINLITKNVKMQMEGRHDLAVLTINV